MIEPGALVFYQCPKNSWVVGTVDTWDGKVATCRAADAADGKEPVSGLKDANVFVAREDIISEDVNDLLNLTVLHDATLLTCLKRRYLKDVIYTNIGAIVVALNPFNFKIPWYMDDKMSNYLNEGDTIEKNLPHSWAVAHNTYFEMRNDGQNQSILVSGESGAGKTEASKIVMKYLGAISCRTGSDEQRARGRGVGDRIGSSSLPLEAYGNAKTVRNDNSSRFGKFMAIKFDAAGFLVGAQFTKYLLEKSRIVTSAQGERCYHALYLVARGSEAQRLKVTDDKAFRILTAGKTLNNKEYDTAADFSDVCKAMETIGMSKAEIASMWAVVGGVLHMGNVLFQPDGEGSLPTDATKPSIAIVADIWKVDLATLEKEMLTTTLQISGQVITKVLNPIAALDSKEALMKALYDTEFGWLVEKCNAMLDVPECSSWIGLLDIFGFEDFEVNSFEQVCINLTNETLQGHYNEYIFKRDMEECRAEGVDMSSVEFPDNGPCIQMITSKGGILALLDEECMLGKGTDMSFLQKISAACASSAFFVRKQLQKSSFTIRHYAGDVTYEVASFLDKNRDTLKDAFKLLMRSSSDPFIAGLLPEPSDAKRMTVGAFFKNQLQQLMDVLQSTNPHWIRCVKPHPAKKPLMWHGVNVMNQLSSSGVLGTVKIRKAGYPVRIKHADFLARYNVMGKEIAAVLKYAKVEGIMAQIGTVRVFLKSEAYIKLEAAKKEALQDFARTIQGFIVTTQLVNAFRVKQRESNKAFIEEVRVSARRLLEYQHRAEEKRNAFIKTVLAAKTELKTRYEAKLKEFMEEFLAYQRQMNRIEYEKKKKQMEEQAQREAKERAKREAKEKLERQRREEARELEELRERAESARRERQEQELAMAMSLQTQTEAHLCVQAGKIFRRRQERQIEDRVKAEAARIRKLEYEQSILHRKHEILMETETAAVRGAIAKSQTLIEQRQMREITRLKVESRRREVADRLHDEEDRRERFTRLRIAMSDAKYTFIEEQKNQLLRDAQHKKRLEHMDQVTHDRYVERMHLKAARREYRELTATRVGLEKAESAIDAFRRRAEREDEALTSTAKEKVKTTRLEDTEKDQDRLRHHIDSIRDNVRDLGQTAFRPAVAAPASPARSTEKHVDPRRRALERLHELVSPETEMLYERLRKESELEIMKYALTVPPRKPLQDLPWRI
jgi:myosin heavy subunit